MKVCTLCLLLAAAACSSDAATPSNGSTAGPGADASSDNTSTTAGGGGNGGAAGPGSGGGGATAGGSGSAGMHAGSDASTPAFSDAAATTGGSGGSAGSAGGAGSGPAGGSAGASGALDSGGAAGSAGASGELDSGGPTDSGMRTDSAEPGEAASLQGLTLQVKCGAAANQERSCNYLPPGDANCGSNQVRTYAMASKKMGGAPGTTYDVTLRIRGIVEANEYTGGTSDMNGFYVGGTVGGKEGGSQYSQYSLQVSSPATTYHLNQLDPGTQQDKYKNLSNGGVVHHFGFMIDYRETMKVEGGATVTLKGQDNDCLMGRNCKPPANDFGHCELQKMEGLSDDQVPQGATGFDGNFIWIDVEKATISQ